MSIFRLNAEVEINAERLIEGLDSLVDDDVKTRIHALFAETVDPWTPFLTGALHSDITVDAEGVTYNVPYAAEKYYGTVFHKEEHPLATDHWDKVAMETEMEAFVEKVKEILTMRAKQAHG
jgi:hypothetical protein